MNHDNGVSPTLTFSVVPLDCCPRCKRIKPRGNWGLAVPLAIAFDRGSLIVRNVCPSCRLTWDTSWGVHKDDPVYGPFEDTYLLHSEGVESHPQGGSVFPAGPRNLLEQRPT